MESYLDNSATTPCTEDVASLVVKLMTKEYGNPSSMHKRGFEAEQYIKKAQETFADIWKVTPAEIYFTSGGTESDNLAVYGAVRAKARQGKHIITTKIEHPAISSPLKQLQEDGYEVTYLDVDSEGIISLEALKASIRKDTVLVSIMHVNNEIGSVQPIAEAGRIIKESNPACLFHVDDIQGFGKLNLYPKKMNIDMISVSGHKIHGPKGTGVLYINKSALIKPLILGGGQQKAIRSGTENVSGIAGIALAAESIYKGIQESSQRLYELRSYMIQRLSSIEGIQINGAVQREDEILDPKIAPHIISMSVTGIRAEVLLHALEEKEVFVSAGSACSSNKPAISETLKAIGLDKSLLDCTVRLSFSVHTTKEELDYAYEAISEVLPILRRYTRR